MITKIVESRLGDNYDKKLDLFQEIEDLIKEYPDIETHVVEEIFGGKDKFDSYDVSKHKVNEVANLLGRVKRYVEDNVGYDKTQTKNESLKEDLDSEWRELETKQITDFDGFLTDYTLYTNGVTYICMYGDKDVYSPDIDEADYESDSEDEAYEWFNNYNGFDEDYIDEGVNMVSKVNESKLTEGYYDISVDDIRSVISRLEDLVSGLEDLGMSSIKPISNTYGMSNFVGIASKGYIDLDSIDDYLGDSEDEEYEEESLTESEESSSEFYGVFEKGGSIGKSYATRDDLHVWSGRDAGTLVKVFSSSDEAKNYAKRMRSRLSPGERSYYGIGYFVKKLSKKNLEHPRVIDMISNMPGYSASQVD